MSEEKHNLLLVDDDETFCLVLSRALRKRKFTVSVAHTQKDAFEIASKQIHEYAIVDLCIGEDSGLNVIKSLMDIDSSIRIVVLTGYASISTAVEAIKLGANHYLTKPVNIEDILKAFDHQGGNENVSVSTQPMSVKRMEWEHLQKVLHDHDGNISATARAMGMHRRTLQRKLSKKPVKL
ncbi:MAG: response regulator transcription factor [Gammaproteobacteria bacterium]|nr:response regulator transcription factor [Gammaproteobacteria bacterium]